MFEAMSYHKKRCDMSYGRKAETQWANHYTTIAWSITTPFYSINGIKARIAN